MNRIGHVQIIERTFNVDIRNIIHNGLPINSNVLRDEESIINFISLTKSLIEQIESEDYSDKQDKKTYEDYMKKHNEWLEGNKKEIPNFEEIEFNKNYLCPITMELMYDPVMNESGNTYERVNILKWIKDKDTDPVTNVKLKNKDLISNNILKSIINEELDKLKGL